MMTLFDQKKYLKIFILLWVVLLILTCNSNDQQPTLVNLSHLDHLYEEIIMDSIPAAIIHIYADYPDYKWVEATGEGIACVDDVARAAVFYLRHYQYVKEEASLSKARKLLQFILDMQAANGLFYNFIHANHSINKTRHNSQPKADWWSWRAIWALGEAYPVFVQIDPDFSDKIDENIKETFPSIDSLVRHYPKTQQFEGFTQPNWLPLGGAADQTSELLLGLIPYYSSTLDSSIKPYILKLCDGLIKMQIGDSSNYPFGAFLTWQNTWHAWGNSQAEVLIRAGKVLNNESFIERGLREVRFFYPYILNENFVRKITFRKENKIFEPIEIQKFSQIAYNIRPMVMASLAAYEVTGKEHFAEQAGKIACWFLGRNPADQLMYNLETGRCFDGINNPDVFNKNSGAESTIEALLALLEVEKYDISKKIANEFYQQRKVKVNTDLESVILR